MYSWFVSTLSLCYTVLPMINILTNMAENSCWQTPEYINTAVHCVNKTDLRNIKNNKVMSTDHYR